MNRIDATGRAKARLGGGGKSGAEGPGKGGKGGQGGSGDDGQRESIGQPDPLPPPPQKENPFCDAIMAGCFKVCEKCGPLVVVKGTCYAICVAVGLMCYGTAGFGG